MPGWWGFGGGLPLLSPQLPGRCTHTGSARLSCHFCCLIRPPSLLCPPPTSAAACCRGDGHPCAPAWDRSCLSAPVSRALERLTGSLGRPRPPCKGSPCPSGCERQMARARAPVSALVRRLGQRQPPWHAVARVTYPPGGPLLFLVSKGNSFFSHTINV